MSIGEKILNLRKARGWSQEELAERVGVSRQAVSRWEADAAKPDAEKIIALCDLFGVSADYLLRDISGAGVENTTVRSAKPVGFWVSWGLTAFGAVTLFVLRILASVNRTYISPAIFENEHGIVSVEHGGYYTGFWYYVQDSGFEWLFWLAVCALCIGVGKLLWPRFQKTALYGWFQERW